jgi:DNA polymerase-3 subunit alpha
MIINKARELGIFIDYGRGSVSGSATCWLLGISGVDAVEKQLIFERFVSRTRAGKKIIDGSTYLKGDLLADVDINLGDGIPAITNWLNELYPNRISRITNYSTFTTKILLKDSFKSLKEASEGEAKEVSDMIEVHFGISQEIDEAYEKNPSFKKWVDEHKDIITVSKKLSGLLRQVSIHASGWLCSFFKLNGIIPLEISKDGQITSSYDMKEISNFAIKLDLLGLQTNRVIKQIIDKLKIDVNTINLDNNEEIYSRFQNNDLLPYGLYQISADCAYGVLNQIKPKNIYELSDVNACARPGALSYVRGYVLGDHPCPHPVFEKVLSRTRNFCLYQEQMMQMAVAVGFTLEEAEMLRKIVGKKLVDKVKEWREKIYTRCEQNGFNREIGDILWKVLEDSAKYSFNLSHSLSTSYLSALTVYLKYKYPVEFYWACLCGVNSLAAPLEEITLIQKELKFFNIKLLPPDILKSEFDYTIENGDIRTGISAMRNLSKANLEKLKSFKATITNKFDLFLSLQDAHLSVSVISSLVLSGAFDNLNSGSSRNRLLLEYEVWNELTPREIPIIHGLGSQFNYDLITIIKECSTNLKNEKGKLLINEKRIITLRKNTGDFFEKYKRNSQFEELTQYLAENYYLGFSYSHSLKSIYEKRVQGLVDLKSLKPFPEGEYKAVCQIVEMEKRTSKAKNDYVKFFLKDDTGIIHAMLFRPEIIEGNQEIEEDAIVIAHLTKKWKQGGDPVYFIKNIVPQEVPTILKVSQLEKKTKSCTIIN